MTNVNGDRRSVYGSVRLLEIIGMKRVSDLTAGLSRYPICSFPNLFIQCLRATYQSKAGGIAGTPISPQGLTRSLLVRVGLAIDLGISLRESVAGRAGTENR
jgi:hypothetical protein